MPTATYIPLQTITLSGTASTVTFGSIPNTYKDLVLVGIGTLTANFGDIKIRFNGESTNYSNVLMSGNGSTAVSNNAGGATDAIRFNFYGGWNSTNPSNLVAQIMDYSATDKHKTALGRINSGGGGTFNGVDAGAGRWASTNAITSITLLTNSPSFASGSTFSLYGIAG